MLNRLPVSIALEHLAAALVMRRENAVVEAEVAVIELHIDGGDAVHRVLAHFEALAVGVPLPRDWRQDGYRLFEISVFAGSSAKGWFALPEETNALFLHRSRFDSLGGFDTRFVLPGGGLVNHDFWTRACTAAEARVVMLLGEGTFHQFHGGVATNARTSPWDAFAAEYRSVTGRDYAPVSADFTLYGALSPQARRHLLTGLGGGPGSAPSGGAES